MAEALSIKPELLMDLLYDLGYMKVSFGTEWRCRRCVALVRPNGVKHDQRCPVGKAEKLLIDDPRYLPPVDEQANEYFVH